MNTEHIIKEIMPGSAAERLGLLPGDELISINGETVTDVFDFRFLEMESDLTIEVKRDDIITIFGNKDADEELGLVFENGLMDNYRSCRNKCIFCFIDQLPKGMRDTLYFKDDDSRLSFLQGNYITLTNLSDEDVQRIIKYNMSPINISFQTTNPELRCKMLNNRFAGETLRHVKSFYDAGLKMNGQIVLCKGVNDKAELERTFNDLMEYLPYLESVSVVPVGLTRYREGLYPLEPFNRDDACDVIDLIESIQDKAYSEYGLHFAHASDEWYILAGRDMPAEETYDGYLQLENGVGMLRLLLNEFSDAMAMEKKKIRRFFVKKKKVSIATGHLAYPYIRKMCDEITENFPKVRINVYDITNDFFGEHITVSGLLTGSDIINQLKGKSLGETLFLPVNMLRSGENYFLDDVTVPELEDALQVKTFIVKSSGYDFLSSILYEK